MSFEQMLTYPRSRAGWEAAASLLADGCWHSPAELAAHVAAATDLQPSATPTLIRDGVKAGYLRRRRSGNQTRFHVTQKGLDERPELRVR